MNVTRLDLDGTGSPTGLVTKILKAEPGLKIPVPIEDLAIQLDIKEIAELETEGFEGGLVTDKLRSTGGILVRKGVHRQRRRFTIAHELGHFLMPFHTPVRAGEFLCKSEDMRRWTASEQDRHFRMEVEANQFAALMLMPPPYLRQVLHGRHNPDLSDVFLIHEQFDVSREAAARAYALYQGDAIAIAIIKDGALLRSYRHPQFPALGLSSGDRVPKASGYYNSGTQIGIPSDLRLIDGGHWLDVAWGDIQPKLYEQVVHQTQGFSMILLWPEPKTEDEYDPEENLTSKERYQRRLATFDR